MADVLEIRGLQEEEEVAWLDMLAEAFSHRNVPRSLFAGRREGDPHFRHDCVRVAIDGGAVVSTVR